MGLLAVVLIGVIAKLNEERRLQKVRELQSDLVEVQKYWHKIAATETILPEFNLRLIGPSDAVILKGLLKAKNYIMLFLGEAHLDVEEEAKGMFVWNFFRLVDVQREMKLFIEQPIAKPANKYMLFAPNRGGTTSKFGTIFEIRRYVVDCTTEQSIDCPLKQTQVISIDPRLYYGPDGNSGPIRAYNWQAFIAFIGTKNEGELEEFLTTLQAYLFDKSGSEENIGLSLLIQLIQPIRRILRDVKKKEEQLFLKIQNWFQLYQLVLKMQDWFRLQDGRHSYTSAADVEFITSCCLMDLYAVCKLCLMMEPKKPNIVYVGKAHLPNMVDFFSSLYFEEVFQKTTGTPQDSKSVLLKMKDMAGILEPTHGPTIIF